jgi:hypothetical protein
MNASEPTTTPQPAETRAGEPVRDSFALIREAIAERSQVWAYVDGRAIHFCPQTLGWHGDDAYVHALVLQPRPGSVVEGGTWQWLLRWQWIRLADLQIPTLGGGQWIGCPREQRPDTNFLSRVYCEAA